MSRARLVITAVVVEGRSQAEVARAYGVSPSWVSRLVARYRSEGDAAFESRSRRPKRSPGATPSEVVERIVQLRGRLVGEGLDAGPDSIVWHLARDGITVSASTVARRLRNAGLVTPQPQKRPRSSYTRFEAEMPNECWQSDFTHYRLADGTDIEILGFMDDHSRLCLHLSAHPRVTGPRVVDAFRTTIERYGTPASTLTDNGMVFTTRLSGGKGGRNGFENELRRLGIVQKNSRPNHPTTCGKIERFHQTMKRWLDAKSSPPATLPELQALLDQFRAHYNEQRGHSSLPHRATPATAYQRRPKAGPGDRSDDRHRRVRRDKIDKAGKVSLRHDGKMIKIGVGRTHARTPVILLIEDLDVRVINAITGELLRALTIDPTKPYQGTGRPPGTPPRRQP
jgi:transposase InsO family protein